jgi:putative addiction module killer protein
MVPDPWEIHATDIFSGWLANLKDEKAKGKIAARIDRLRHGNPGDVESLGGGVSEMKIDHGPGYRVYFGRVGKTLYLLLCGGDKSSQKLDIAVAKKMLKEIRT